MEKLKLNYELYGECNQVKDLTTSAEEIKDFLDEKLKSLLDLRKLWGKFEICFQLAEEIFKEPNEVQKN